ncbi:retrovirus-related pol polyprotein from transposon TNT 1-94 [Tanacetum coccineum]
MADEKIHPALTVTGIKNTFNVQLSLENGQYLSWLEIFEIYCHAYKVIDHIIPPPPPATSSMPPLKDAPQPKVVDPETWSTLDVIVLQWIYSTIFNGLMHTILEPDTTAGEAWKRLKDIFQDNKNSRAVYLEHEFTNTRLDNFSSVSAYCQELKMLSDQLTNVGASVSNNRLILQLIASLNESYDIVASLIQQSDPPHSMMLVSLLVLDRDCKSKQVTNTASTLLVDYSVLWEVLCEDWLLWDLENVPTDLDQAMHTMTLNPPDDQWNMDIGATSHMTTSQAWKRLKDIFQDNKNSRAVYLEHEFTNTRLDNFSSVSAYCQELKMLSGQLTNVGAPVSNNRLILQLIASLNESYDNVASLIQQSDPLLHSMKLVRDLDQAMHTMTLNPPDDQWNMDTGATSHMTTSQGYSKKTHGVERGYNLLIVVEGKRGMWPFEVLDDKNVVAWRSEIREFE